MCGKIPQMKPKKKKKLSKSRLTAAFHRSSELSDFGVYIVVNWPVKNEEVTLYLTGGS